MKIKLGEEKISLVGVIFSTGDVWRRESIKIDRDVWVARERRRPFSGESGAAGRTGEKVT